MIKTFFKSGLVMLCMLPWVVYANAVKLTDLRIFNTASTTRIIFNFTTVPSAHIFSLSHPDRLVFDFQNVAPNKILRNLQFDQPNIKSVRSGHPQADVWRVVMDIPVAYNYKRIPQADGSQVVVDLYFKPKKNKTTDKIAVESAIREVPVKMPVVNNANKIKTNDIQVNQAPTLAPETIKTPFTVVIDAGHGGKDTGAIGTYQTREKDVVLSIATQLAALINAQPNMRAVLTRKGDYFVPLNDRLILARKGEADLFISIHADSYFNSRASGASVFALSKHGATTVAAKWISDSENHSELNNVELNRLDDQSYILRSVLIDLAQTATIRDSLRFGNSILDVLENITRLHSPRVEQAPFMVLKSPDIPSILVETGFISNTKEELHLRDKAYQYQIAVALFNGIRLYQKKYAPVST